jgi:CRISPR-associated protein Csb2
LGLLLERVVRFGHSSSLVSVRLVDDPGPPTWQPVVNGQLTFRMFAPGQLAALERAFERHREVNPRVMPSVPQPYGRREELVHSAPPQSVYSDEWLVLRRVRGPSFPMTATAGIARAVRRTLMSYADEPIPEALSGHTADERPSRQPHLAVVPLPFVGHEHASGAILGVALILPRRTSDFDRRAVYSSLARWEERSRQGDEDIPSVRLNLGGAGELYLERVEWAAVQASLKPQAWCGPARVWYSATPIALDRNPGDLQSRDPRRLATALEEAIESICRSCERTGVQRPTYVEILPSAPWAGAAKARHYPPYPGDAGRTQRVLTHARVEFEHSVKGPLLLGAGRYVGLGLFRPEACR